MAAGESEMAGSTDTAAQSPTRPAAAAFGFTPAQQIMFQSSSMNGQRVVMVTPEVARSLGIASGPDAEAAPAIQIKEEAPDVAGLDSDTDRMLDPDQFLETELASGKAEAVMDEDLTSLSWLHSKQVLKAPAAAPQVKVIRRPPPSAPEPASQESPTSDYLEDLPELPAAPAPAPAARGRPPGQSSPWSGGKARRHPPHANYNPKVHVHFKPPFSFSCLIFMAIEDSAQKAMPVRDIYDWIQEHFPFYQAAPIGWKNSIRHNLSLNKSFRRMDKETGRLTGKGSLWTVDPLCRPQLLQGLKRSPCVQETPPDVYSEAAQRPWSAAALPGRPPARRREIGGTPLGPAGDGRGVERAEAVARTPHRRPRGAKRSSSGQPRTPSDDSGPDPALFPLLSRRLLSAGSGDAASPADRQGGAAGEDDGEPPLTIVQEPATPEPAPARCRVKVVHRSPHVILDSVPVLVPAAGGRTEQLPPSLREDSCSGGRNSPRLVVIRQSPLEEHTYARRLPPPPDPRLLLPSDDEAFSDDSNLSAHDPSVRPGGGLSPEEAGLRFVQEGADLLLNLAGVPPTEGGAAPRTITVVRRGPGRPPGRGRAGPLR